MANREVTLEYTVEFEVYDEQALVEAYRELFGNKEAELDDVLHFLASCVVRDEFWIDGMGEIKPCSLYKPGENVLPVCIKDRFMG